MLELTELQKQLLDILFMLLMPEHNWRDVFGTAEWLEQQDEFDTVYVVWQPFIEVDGKTLALKPVEDVPLMYLIHEDKSLYLCRVYKVL